MKLIVGLGNPGREYLLTRHNIGFMVLDSIAHKYGMKFNKLKYKSFLAGGFITGEEVLLAKPLTYMNLSGEAIKELVDGYGISLNFLLIIHDDLDLPGGTLRLRARGGSGGHKGLNSIIEKLHTKEFNRLRIGIGRPSELEDAADHVLGRFIPEEEPAVKKIIKKAVSAVEVFIVEGIEEAMNRFNIRDNLLPNINNSSR